MGNKKKKESWIQLNVFISERSFEYCLPYFLGKRETYWNVSIKIQSVNKIFLDNFVLLFLNTYIVWHDRFCLNV